MTPLSLLHAGLLNALLAGLLAAAVAVLARLCRGRPALVHGLWLLVLLKFVTPPLAAVPLPWPSPPPADAPPLGPFPEAALPPECPAVTLRAAPPAEGEPPAAEAPADESAPEPAWPTLVLLVWLAGALACWSTAAARLARLARVLRGVPAAPPCVQGRVAALAARLGLRRPPPALLVPGVLPPMLLACGPWVRLLLPAGLWARLDEAQRDTLLLHELAHLRRADQRVRWLELLVRGLYWWHPAAWWAGRALRDAEEECCDAWVVWAAPGAAPAYAATLVETIAFLSRSPAALPAGASGAGPVRLIKRRLTMILRGKTPPALSRPALLAVALAGAALLPLAPAPLRSAPPEEATARRDALAAAGASRPDPLLLNARSCQACHGAPRKDAGKAFPARKTEDLHAEVVRLLSEAKKRQLEWLKAQAALQDAVKRFDAEQAKPRQPKVVADPRKEGVEQKLERLLREVEALRREMRRKERESRATPGGKVIYTRQRSFSVPVRVSPGHSTYELWVTADGGTTWQLAVQTRASNPDNVSFATAHDGTFGFKVLSWGPTEKAPKGVPSGTAPAYTVVVDCQPPVVGLTGTAGQTPPVVVWGVRDENLDLNTLHIEFRKTADSPWVEQPVTKNARGTVALSRDAVGGEVRLRVSDRAGNVGFSEMKLK